MSKPELTFPHQLPSGRVRTDVPLLSQDQLSELHDADAKVAKQFASIAPATALIVSDCKQANGNRIGILDAPHGTGKSTWLPYCLMNSLSEQGRILVAVASSRTIDSDADFLLRQLLRVNDRDVSTTLGRGGIIGFRKSRKFEYDNSNRLVYTTHGVLSDMLVQNKVDGYQVIVVDDASEMSENLEVACAVLKHRHPSGQLPKLLITGANVAELYAGYFGREHVFIPDEQVGAPCFDIDVFAPETHDFAPCDDVTQLPSAVEEIVSSIRDDSSSLAPKHAKGDVVVFLPNVDTVEKTVGRLKSQISKSLQVYRHHANIGESDNSALLESEQRAAAAFESGSPTGPQRIVISDGSEPTRRFSNVRVVIDSGMVSTPHWDPMVVKRQKSLNWNSDSGCMRRLSQLGCVQDGAYFQLFPSNAIVATHGRTKYPLAKTYLRLLCAGISNPQTIECLGQVQSLPNSGNQALSELQSLRAVAGGKATSLGRQLEHIAGDTVDVCRCLEAADTAACSIEVASFLAFSKHSNGLFLLNAAGATKATELASSSFDDLEFGLRVLSGWLSEKEEFRSDWARSQGLDEKKLTKIESEARRILKQFQSQTKKKGDPLRREFDFQRLDRVRLVIAYSLKAWCFRRSDKVSGEKCSHMGLGPNSGSHCIDVHINSAAWGSLDRHVLVCVNRVRHRSRIIGTSFVKIPEEWTQWLDSQGLIAVLHCLKQPSSRISGQPHPADAERESFELGKTTLVCLLRRIEDGWLAKERTTDSIALVRLNGAHRAQAGDYALVTIEGRSDEFNAWEARLADVSIVESLKSSARVEFDEEQCLTVHALKRLVNCPTLWAGKSEGGEEYLMIGAKGQFRSDVSYRLQRIELPHLECRVAVQEPLLSEITANQIVFEARVAKASIARDGHLRGYDIEISDGVFAFLTLRMAPTNVEIVEGALIVVVVLERMQFDAPKIVHFDRLKHRFPLVFDELARLAEQPNEQGVRAMVALHFSGHAPPEAEALLCSVELSSVPSDAMGCYLACLINYSKDTPRLHEPLVEFLQTGECATLKRLVANALSRFSLVDGADQYLAFCRRQLRSENTYDRCAAATTLVSKFETTTDEIHAVISEAVSAGVDAEFSLVDALSTRGVNALSDVVLMSRSDRSAVRRLAAELLVEIAKKYDGNFADQVTLILHTAVQLCDHPDVEVRLGAAKALRQISSCMLRGGTEFRHAESTSEVLNQVSTICESLFVGETSYRIRRELLWAMPNEAEFKYIPGDASRKIAFLQRAICDESYSVRIQSQACLWLSRLDPSVLRKSLEYPLSVCDQNAVSIKDLGSNCIETQLQCFSTIVEGEASQLYQLSFGLLSDEHAIVSATLDAISEIGDSAQPLASDLFDLLFRTDDLTVMRKLAATFRNVYRYAGLTGVLTPSLSQELGTFLRKKAISDSATELGTKLTRLFNFAYSILDEEDVFDAMSRVPRQSQRIALKFTSSMSYTDRERAFRLLAILGISDDPDVRHAVLTCMANDDPILGHAGFFALSLFRNADPTLCRAVIAAQERLLEYRRTSRGITATKRRGLVLPYAIALCLTRCGDYAEVKAALKPSIAESIRHKRRRRRSPYSPPEPLHIDLWHLIAELRPWFEAHGDATDIALSLWQEALEYRQRYYGPFDGLGNSQVEAAVELICRLRPDDVVAHLLELQGNYAEGQISCIAFHVSFIPAQYIAAAIDRVGRGREPAALLRAREGIELMSIVEQCGPKAAVGLVSVAADAVRFSTDQRLLALELLLNCQLIHPECAAHLLVCLRRGPFAVRILAANACGEHGRLASKALPILKKMTASWRRPIRKAAAAAIAAIEEDLVT